MCCQMFCLCKVLNIPVSLFQGFSGIIDSREALSEIHEDIESFAKSESLTAHANSIAVRFEGEE